MFRRFCLRSRSLLAMLLAVCLVSASLWSYGEEAMTDALSDEIAVAVVGRDSGDHSPVGKICNHGCHAQAQLMGLGASMPALNLSDAATLPRVEEGSMDVPTQPRDSPFRPPRRRFQA